MTWMLSIKGRSTFFCRNLVEIDGADVVWPSLMGFGKALIELRVVTSILSVWLSSVPSSVHISLGIHFGFLSEKITLTMWNMQWVGSPVLVGLVLVWLVKAGHYTDSRSVIPMRHKKGMINKKQVDHFICGVTWYCPMRCHDGVDEGCLLRSSPQVHPAFV